MRYVSNFATVLFIVALPVLLVTSNIRYLLGDVAFYERGLRKYDAEEATGIALEELNRSAAEIVRYFEDDSETLRVIVMEDGEETSLFNARETTHMEDVKRLVWFMFRVNEISLGFVVIYVGAVVLWSRERSMRRLAAETLAAVGLAFAVLGGVGIFFALGFDAAWDQFHEIVFPNDLWRLNPDTDHMIQMFPEKFWAEATFVAGGLSFAELALLVILAAGYLLIARSPKLEPSIEALEGASSDDADLDIDSAVASDSDDATVSAAESESEATDRDTDLVDEEMPEPGGGDGVKDGSVTDVEFDASDDSSLPSDVEMSEQEEGDDVEDGPVSEVELDASDDEVETEVEQPGLGSADDNEDGPPTEARSDNAAEEDA